MKVKTRFAPSPTGFLHVGGARTALYSWLYARHLDGEFVLRIEDTDLERSSQEAVDAILESMQWLDLNWDEGPYYQTKRFDRYNAVIDQMLEQGTAYRCYYSQQELEKMREEQIEKGEKPRYNRFYRDPANQKLHNPSESHVVRFANPIDGSVVFNDMVRGHIEISNEELDDLIIRRSDGSPTYNFCVVVDDWDMGITHVIRGEDHINNTPRQINILKALGAPIPEYGHVSMILGNDGQKLSKRHGAVSVMQYRDDGYLPEALNNYLIRLGWGHGDQEIFSRQEMIELFDIHAVSHSASAFNLEKLQWLNQHYMKTLPAEHVAKYLAWHMQDQQIDTSHGPKLETIIEILAERCKTLKDMAANSKYFYQEFNSYDENAAKKHLSSKALPALTLALEKLSNLTDWQQESIHKIIEDTATELEIGMGKVGMPLRVAVTGGGQSPALDLTILYIGKERCIARIIKAIEYLQAIK